MDLPSATLPVLGLMPVRGDEYSEEGAGLAKNQRARLVLTAQRDTGGLPWRPFGSNLFEIIDARDGSTRKFDDDIANFDAGAATGRVIAHAAHVHPWSVRRIGDFQTKASAFAVARNSGSSK